MEEYTDGCGSSSKEIKKQSKVIYNLTEINRFGNKYNIEFNVSSEDNDEMDLIFVNSLVNQELLLRKLPITGNLLEQKAQLLPQLKTELRLTGILDVIARTAEGKDAALMLIKQAIICIMHMENHLGENLISMLLSTGAERFQKERRVASLDEYIMVKQRHVCTRILGAWLYPRQWKIPAMNDGKEVSITTSNTMLIYSFVPNLLQCFGSLQVGKIK